MYELFVVENLVNPDLFKVSVLLSNKSYKVHV